MIITEPIVILTSASRTTSGSTTVDMKGAVAALFVLDVTAQSGSTPTLDVDFEYTDPILGDIVLDDFAQVGATTGEYQLSYPNVDWVAIPRDLKVSWTLGGSSPNYTFSLTAVVKRDL